jgi:hypothetical protein
MTQIRLNSSIFFPSLRCAEFFSLYIEVIDSPVLHHVDFFNIESPDSVKELLWTTVTIWTLVDAESLFGRWVTDKSACRGAVDFEGQGDNDRELDEKV